MVHGIHVGVLIVFLIFSSSPVFSWRSAIAPWRGRGEIIARGFQRAVNFLSGRIWPLSLIQCWAVALIITFRFFWSLLSGTYNSRNRNSLHSFSCIQNVLQFGNNEGCCAAGYLFWYLVCFRLMNFCIFFHSELLHEVAFLRWSWHHLW